MDELDRFCALIFDELSLSSGLSYESHRQRISGFEDLGALGRTSNPANHALVFMVRVLRKRYKAPVAYFFTKDCVKPNILKQLLITIISELQRIGMTVCATICDQGSTNRSAITALTREHTDDKPTSYHFVVNGESIVTLFDVPHLLKNTRNALINCRIEFSKGKFASMDHIKQAFFLDKSKRTCKCLNKLRESHFNFNDTYMKVKVNVAA